VRAEPEVVLYRSSAFPATAHQLVLCPSEAQVKPSALRIATTGAGWPVQSSKLAAP
jgi:hypothetical protein